LRFERIVGKTLTELGYATANDGRQRDMDMEMRATRLIYRTYFEGKLWLRGNPLASRLRPLTAAHIDATVLGEDHPLELKTAVSSQPPGGSR
jgi:hypothetical protein